MTKCSGEGIYFAAKSGRMAAEAVVECVRKTGKLPTEKQLKQTYIKDYDKLYKPTYLVLDILQKVRVERYVLSENLKNMTAVYVSHPIDGLQCLVSLCLTLSLPLRCPPHPKVFYSNNAAREAFVELCESEYVQRVTFDSYLYKKVGSLVQCFVLKLLIALEAIAVHMYIYMANKRGDSGLIPMIDDSIIQPVKLS